MNVPNSTIRKRIAAINRSEAFKGFLFKLPHTEIRDNVKAISECSQRFQMRGYEFLDHINMLSASKHDVIYYIMLRTECVRVIPMELLTSECLSLMLEKTDNFSNLEFFGDHHFTIEHLDELKKRGHQWKGAQLNDRLIALRYNLTKNQVAQ